MAPFNEDITEYFLFERSEGYCKQYAAAAMNKELGIIKFPNSWKSIRVNVLFLRIEATWFKFNFLCWISLFGDEPL